MRQKIFAECFGTFTIVFAPTALQAFSRASATLLNDSLVSGLSVMAMILAFAEVSGAHFNPAVTVWLAFEKKFEWKDVPPYAGAQFLGSLLAALSVWFFAGFAGTGVHIPHIAPLQAILLETLLTVLLILTIAGTAGQTKTGSALTIGLLITTLVLIAGPVTGGSMNPARSLGPAIVTALNGNFIPLQNYYVYFVGPLLGSGLLGYFNRAPHALPTE